MNAHDTDPDELSSWLRLTLTPGVGNDASRQLLSAFGSAQAIFAQSAQSLRQLGTERLVQAIHTEPSRLPALLQTTLDWLRAGDDRCIATLGDAAYPTALLDIEDPPLMLYLMGSHVHASVAASPINIAIVGSRNPTPQGELNAREFAQAFAQLGLCVVSGMALGIDGAAHDGALRGGGPTIAVVGTGLDRVYPKKHLTLAHRIAQQGLLMSEFPLGTPPLTANFPKRNRIISGLSRGTLVVEAALKSGSLITARMAVEQGKEVFAVPGSIHSPQSRGCHALIKQGAKLVELAQDVLEELQLDTAPERTAVQLMSVTDRDAPSTGHENPLLTAIGHDLVTLDALQARTGLATPTLQAQLLELELIGQLARLPGGLFQRLTNA